MDPRLKSVGFPKVRDPAPGEHEGVLQRVLGETVIAQDPLRDRVELIADLVHQDGERLTVSAAGLLDEVSTHLGLRWAGPAARSTPMTGGRGANVQPTHALQPAPPGPSAPSVRCRARRGRDKCAVTGHGHHDHLALLPPTDDPAGGGICTWSPCDG